MTVSDRHQLNDQGVHGGLGNQHYAQRVTLDNGDGANVFLCRNVPVTREMFGIIVDTHAVGRLTEVEAALVAEYIRANGNQIHPLIVRDGRVERYND